MLNLSIPGIIINNIGLDVPFCTVDFFAVKLIPPHGFKPSLWFKRRRFVNIRAFVNKGWSWRWSWGLV
ncbi:hypothetical protein PBCV1_a096R [Paramecium bursaria Chlorella virus 1]|uniref:Uncharacterized protein n=1 Tax=Paramecium bursaria Chlorella virus 1 TaxID=10506 RepID=Q84417_PBCV1|nr:hypothetical protein PBCV1_a096R [Paramecium bursaria Chlorella virus 1]AAC96464.1 hypothetical protein [Paramecium bursaria Chlorella virus 1]